ncbi:MAG TPA: phosphatidylglycerophosphatase A, partial [Acidisarcina sp.]
MTRPPAVAARTSWAWIAGTFFGAGNIKPGPGTWGSVAALLIWFAAARLPFFANSPHASFFPWATAAAALVALAIGIPAGTIVAEESHTEDPQHVVLDEVVGQWIALIACPADWVHPLLALALFRLFDITKPPPA